MPSAPMLTKTRRTPCASSTSHAASICGIVSTGQSVSAASSMRLGLTVSKRPMNGFSSLAQAVDTGST